MALANSNKNRIVTNNSLGPTRREIRNWDRDFRISDGPNSSAFLSLDDIGIPYDSHYLSRIILPGSSENYELKYGILDEITFLLLKITYNGNYDHDINLGEDSFDPLYYYEPNVYNITYHYEDNPDKKYPINRLLLLTSSQTNKINKIYLNNPIDYDVAIEVLAANIDDIIITPVVTNSAKTISNLYYSNIITDTVQCNSGFTGSTQLVISNYSLSTGCTSNINNVLFSDIIKIFKDDDYIYILTSDNYYTLEFLTWSDFYKAYCRIIYVYNSYLNDGCSYLDNLNIYEDNIIIETC